MFKYYLSSLLLPISDIDRNRRNSETDMVPLSAGRRSVDHAAAHHRARHGDGDVFDAPSSVRSRTTEDSGEMAERRKVTFSCILALKMKASSLKILDASLHCS